MREDVRGGERGREEVSTLRKMPQDVNRKSLIYDTLDLQEGWL